MHSNGSDPYFKYSFINQTWSLKCKLLNLDLFLINCTSMASIFGRVCVIKR